MNVVSVHLRVGQGSAVRALPGRVLLKFTLRRIRLPEHPILRFLISAAIGRPKLAIGLLLLALASLAAAFSYTGFLVIGVLADFLGTGRFSAGLLLALVFARFPSIREGKLGMVGLLPKWLRRPLMATLVALCLLHFAVQGDAVPAAFAGFTLTVILGFPWLKKIGMSRMSAFVSPFTPRARAAGDIGGTVIEGEFREVKE